MSSAVIPDGDDDLATLANLWHWTGRRCTPGDCPGADECCYAEDEDARRRMQDFLASLTEAGYDIVPAGRTREEWATGPAGQERWEMSEQVARRRVGNTGAPVYHRVLHIGPWERAT